MVMKASAKDRARRMMEFNKINFESPDYRDVKWDIYGPGVRYSDGAYILLFWMIADGVRAARMAARSRKALFGCYAAYSAYVSWVDDVNASSNECWHGKIHLTQFLNGREQRGFEVLLRDAFTRPSYEGFEYSVIRQWREVFDTDFLAHYCRCREDVLALEGRVQELGERVLELRGKE